MSRRLTHIAISTCALLLTVSLAPRANAVPETILVIARPLAEHYGVPGPAVTELLENGVSLESATQLLLVKESSGKSFDDVTATYRTQGEDIGKTADELGVAAEKYSAANVEAAIEKAKADAARNASNKAAEETGKAVDSILGGLNRE